MPLNMKQARQEIQELQLPDFFVELFTGERTLRELGLNAPQQIFNLKNLSRPYRVIPLFEYRNHAYCCEQHPEGPRFIAFDIQQPDDTTVFGKSFQCVLAMLFIDFWQDERNDIVLPMLAEALEFDRFDELLQEIGPANKLATAQWLDWQKRFCKSCEEGEILLWQENSKLDAVA
jgi:hypothetical protein